MRRFFIPSASDLWDVLRKGSAYTMVSLRVVMRTDVIVIGDAIDDSMVQGSREQLRCPYTHARPLMCIYSGAEETTHEIRSFIFIPSYL